MCRMNRKELEDIVAKLPHFVEEKLVERIYDFILIKSNTKTVFDSFIDFEMQKLSSGVTYLHKKEYCYDQHTNTEFEQNCMICRFVKPFYKKNYYRRWVDLKYYDPHWMRGYLQLYIDHFIPYSKRPENVSFYENLQRFCLDTARYKMKKLKEDDTEEKLEFLKFVYKIYFEYEKTNELLKIL